MIETDPKGVSDLPNPKRKLGLEVKWGVFHIWVVKHIIWSSDTQ